MTDDDKDLAADSEENEGSDPLNASLHRKLMGLRSILFGLVGLVLAVTIINFIDDIELAEWVESVLVGFVAFTVFSFFFTVMYAIMDLVVHFVPDGAFKRMLLKGRLTGGLLQGKGSPEIMAREYATIGYALALFPLIIPAVVIGTGFVVLLVIGGFGAVSEVVQGTSFGLSPWLILMLGVCIGVAGQAEDSSK